MIKNKKDKNKTFFDSKKRDKHKERKNDLDSLHIIKSNLS